MAENDNPEEEVSASLNEKQRMFCREYLVDLNATQAAIRAGYSAATAQPASSRLLSNVIIQGEIQKLMEQRSERVEITADTVLRELLIIAKTDIGEAFNDDGRLKDIHSIPESARRAIAGIEVYEEYAGKGQDREAIGQTKKVRFWDKTKSLELLCRHLGLLNDKMQHTGADGGAIQIESTRTEVEKLEFAAMLAKARAE